ncbi:COG4315 family predicted lipoprotein [Kitasatospora sp. NBC_01266]|uniref:COG4315 family predicted lipoprotein n=1 Tax=Kitasatospora sp. NBC_01266 TaxID=2903572 RepID=UPI002E2EFEEA|nr:hypothetical protein [Kitasatospora sp. NBC_01266]
MKPVLSAVAGAAALAALVAGCSSSSSSSSKSTSSSASAPSVSATAAPASGVATLKTANSPDGQILVDGSGRTLYLFESDTGSTSTCNGSCAAAWPPLLTTGAPNSSGVTASLVGTSTRADHTTQVTYKGHPLYLFADDAKAGDVNGQGATAFGGKWYVVSPSGAAITSTGTPTATSTATTPAATPSSTSGGGGGY